MQTAPLFLVSCVGEKAPEACAAADLYRSDWFRKARAYVEASGGDWLILSAEHGVLAPTDTVAPYDRTLNRMGKAERQAWAWRVVEQLKKRGVIAEGRRVVFLAGERYRDPALVWWLELYGPVEVPMRGLGLGEQKAWLAARAAELLAEQIAAQPAWRTPSPRARKLGELAGLAACFLSAAAIALTPVGLAVAGVSVDLALATLAALLTLPAILGTRAPPPDLAGDRSSRAAPIDTPPPALAA